MVKANYTFNNKITYDYLIFDPFKTSLFEVSELIRDDIMRRNLNVNGYIVSGKHYKIT